MKKILITGGAGGLGLAATKYFSSRGWTVYAADFNETALADIGEKNVIALHMDVSKTESVDEAVRETAKTTDTLDGIVNFAGVMSMGSMIESDTEIMRRIMDINLLGMYRVNRAFFEMVRKGEGRIINISSECGIFSASPFNGFYATVKHAVETYSDALRRETMFLGVPVIKIRPGAFRTNMQGSAEAMFDKLLAGTKYYPKVLGKMHVMLKSGTAGAKDPAILAQVIYRAMTDKKPRLVYSANIDGKQKFMSSLPEKLQDRIYFSLFRDRKD